MLQQYTVKPVFEPPLINNTKIGFQYTVSLNSGQKYCRMLQGQHSAIFSPFIKLPFSINTFVLFFISGCIRQVLLYIVLNPL